MIQKDYVKLLCVLLVLLLCGCSSSSPPAQESISSDDQVIDTAQETSVFETAVSQAMTEAAPPPTATFTQPPPASDTPEPTYTPDSSPTPEIQPTSENPWLLTDWCLDHVGCEKFEVKNQSNFWIAMFLEYTDTGVSKLFSIPPKGHAWITLRPGQYYYQATTCGGTVVNQGNHFLSGKWYWITKETACK
jgi:hypothetical protein